jgi:hypothetical protein
MVQNTGTTAGSGLNIQVAAEGFGSYLQNILPPDIAIAAGAFSATMQQIRNINKTNIEQFAQVVPNLETIRGLNQVNGSGVPTNAALNTAGLSLLSLGSGPKGTYTMSDLYGSMSGLPYPWSSIQTAIQTLTTTKLTNIYNQLFLAVTWEKAKLSITQPYRFAVKMGKAYVPPTASANPPNPAYQPDPLLPDYNPNEYTFAPTNSPLYWSNPGSPEEYNWYYRIVLSFDEDGGGYGRGTAPNPIITVSPNNVGATPKAYVGRDDTNAASQGGGTFGRITRVDANNGGEYLWTSTVQTNWSASNIYPTQTVPFYPPQNAAWVNANMPLETVSIQHPPTATLAVLLNGSISTAGTNTPGDVWGRNGLVSTGEAGWPSPMNQTVQPYVTQANDEIRVIYNKNAPAVGNLNIMWNSTGIQLKIEQRTRYTALSPVPDPKDEFLSQYPLTLIGFVDSIPQFSQNTLPHMQSPTLEAISNWGTAGGQSIVAEMRQERNQARLEKAGIQLDNNIPDKLNPVSLKILQANGTVPLANPSTGVPADTLCGPYTTPSLLTVIVDGDIAFPTPTGYYNQADDTFYTTDQNSAPGSTNIYGNMLTVPNCIDPVVVGPIVPIGIGLPEDTGGPAAEGSLAGSEFQPLIPPNLNTSFTSGSLISSNYSVDEAIEEVIKCNCDCWVS